MKKFFLIASLMICILGISAPAFSYSIDVTYTADNVVGAWKIENGATVNLGLGPHAGEWWNYDTKTIGGLMPGTTYWLGWTLENQDGPAGFLAMIDSSESLISDSLVSSNSWQVSSDGTTWGPAQEYAEYPSGVWGPGTYNGGDLSVFSGSGANWIWDASPGEGEILHIRTQFSTAPVPEPATLFLLGSGLVGLAGYGRKKFRKK